MDNKDITKYIEALDQDWKKTICNKVRDIIAKEAPDAEEVMQWSMPHYKKNGKYLAVVRATKATINVTIFNADKLDAPKDYFESGDDMRKTVKFKEADTVDYALLAKLIKQSASAL